MQRKTVLRPNDLIRLYSNKKILEMRRNTIQITDTNKNTITNNFSVKNKYLRLSGIRIRYPYPVSVSGIRIRYPYPVSVSGIRIRYPYPVSVSGICIRYPVPPFSTMPVVDANNCIN